MSENSLLEGANDVLEGFQAAKKNLRNKLEELDETIKGLTELRERISQELTESEPIEVGAAAEETKPKRAPRKPSKATVPSEPKEVLIEITGTASENLAKDVLGDWEPGVEEHDGDLPAPTPPADEDVDLDAINF